MSTTSSAAVSGLTAIASGVKRAIVLSTDKAVYPINAMGMTKALMEKLIASATKASSRS